MTAEWPATGPFIAGNWVTGEAGSRPVLNPASEQPMGKLSLVSRAQLDAAVAAAKTALPAWRGAAPAQRGTVLLRAADLLKVRLDALARQLTLEQGKTLAESRGEITRPAISVSIRCVRRSLICRAGGLAIAATATRVVGRGSRNFCTTS